MTKPTQEQIDAALFKIRSWGNLDREFVMCGYVEAADFIEDNYALILAALEAYKPVGVEGKKVIA